MITKDKKKTNKKDDDDDFDFDDDSNDSDDKRRAIIIIIVDSDVDDSKYKRIGYTAVPCLTAITALALYTITIYISKSLQISHCEQQRDGRQKQHRFVRGHKKSPTKHSQPSRTTIHTIHATLRHTDSYKSQADDDTHGQRRTQTETLHRSYGTSTYIKKPWTKQSPEY